MLSTSGTYKLPEFQTDSIFGKKGSNILEILTLILYSLVFLNEMENNAAKFWHFFFIIIQIFYRIVSHITLQSRSDMNETEHFFQQNIICLICKDWMVRSRSVRCGVIIVWSSRETQGPCHFPYRVPLKTNNVNLEVTKCARNVNAASSSLRCIVCSLSLPSKCVNCVS